VGGIHVRRVRMELVGQSQPEGDRQLLGWAQRWP